MPEDDDPCWRRPQRFWAEYSDILEQILSPVWTYVRQRHGLPVPPEVIAAAQDNVKRHLRN